MLYWAESLLLIATAVYFRNKPLLVSMPTDAWKNRDLNTVVMPRRAESTM